MLAKCQVRISVALNGLSIIASTINVSKQIMTPSPRKPVRLPLHIKSYLAAVAMGELRNSKRLQDAALPFFSPEPLACRPCDTPVLCTTCMCRIALRIRATNEAWQVRTGICLTSECIVDVDRDDPWRSIFVMQHSVRHVDHYFAARKLTASFSGCTRTVHRSAKTSKSLSRPVKARNRPESNGSWREQTDKVSVSLVRAVS